MRKTLKKIGKKPQKKTKKFSPLKNSFLMIGIVSVLAAVGLVSVMQEQNILSFGHEKHPTPTPSTTTTIVITPDKLDSTSSNPAVVAADGQNKWFLYNDSNDTIDNTLGSFVTGPGTPPHGTGSIEFKLGASPLDRKNIATYQFAGTPLVSIKNMTFGVYSHSGVAGPNESPFLNFNVDFTGSSSAWQRRLVYVPSSNGTVTQDTWQTWDAISSGTAQWTWSGYAANGNKWPDNNTNQYRTWASLMTAFPQARLLPSDGWLGIRVGEPGPANYVGNVDFFSITKNNMTTLYDFDPAPVVPSASPTPIKKPCDKDGWKNFRNPFFKNHGQCVDYMEHHGNGHGDHHDEDDNHHNNQGHH